MYLNPQKKSKLEAALNGFLSEVEAADAAILGSQDGLLVASATRVTLEFDTIAAMSASLISVGDALAGQTGKPDCDQVIAESKHGTTAVVHAANLVLTTMGKAGLNLGMLLSQTRKVATAVSEIMAQPDDATPVATADAQKDLGLGFNTFRDPEALLERVLKELQEKNTKK